MINYSDLNIKKIIRSESINWGDKKVLVYQYIPIEDYYDTIMVAIQKSYENGIYNPIKLDMYLHLNLVYMCTDIVFTDEERADETKLYDELESSGFMDMFLSKIDKKDYQLMIDYVDQITKEKEDYSRSVAGIIEKLINDLPANAEAVKEIVDTFDPKKYQQVMDFAKAANNGNVVPITSVKKE